MLRLVVNSLRFHWRMHGGTLLGTVLAAAILTGALLVGDSVDYSLRQYALARLGTIHFAWESGDRLISEELAQEMQERVPCAVVPALTLPGMAIFTEQTTGRSQQINRVNVIGAPARFWDFDPAVQLELGPYETALNERLAEALGVVVGDAVALRTAKPGLLSRDAPLSSRAEGTFTRARCTVRAILSDVSLGRFSLSADQSAPYNAFVDLEWLQEHMHLQGQVDAVLVGEGVSHEELDTALRQAWQPGHVGVRFRRHASGILQLESDRVFLPAAIANAALSLPGARGTLAYLVNSISKDGKSTPYSFAMAGSMRPDTPVGMRDDEAVINRWLADRLGAQPGDSINIAYYEISASNEFIEKQRTFVVHKIREMADLEIEKDLMPTFPGLSDVERCADWDIGIPMDEALLDDEANETYWEQYGQTPKVFVTLTAGQAMWGNRFGDLMTVRFPPDTANEAAVRDALRRDVAPAEMGLFFAPVRQQALDAVSQAMDLGGLFLGMSFFLITSALILIALLFAFGVQQRASEMGVLLAMGFRPAQVRWLFLGEATVIALAGAFVGAGAGTVYTRVLLFALNHYWPGAVAHADILYHAAPSTLLTGAGASAVCAIGAMAVAMWRQTRHCARELLTMDFSQEVANLASTQSRSPVFWLPIAGFTIVLGLVAYAVLANVDDVVMVFFGAGSLSLLSGLGLCRCVLGRLDTGRSTDQPTLLTLALQNASRRRGRSMSVVALLATGCFLVLAVSSMQEDISAHAEERWSGTGGFELFAETTVPLPENPAAALEDPGVEVVSLRVYEGDDAGCLNLNHAQTPRLLGVNVDVLSSLQAFASPHSEDDLWELLNLDLPDGAVPALVGDSDTAMWGLKKKTGVEAGDVLVYRDDTGHDVNVKLVGRLPMRLSVFQGAVLVSNEAFTRLFPSNSGFRMFLIDTPPGRQDEIAAQLNSTFDRFGLDVVSTVERLRRFYTVQSTYLAMFLVLGGLGMVLGSAALGIVVLRNLLERRREVAVLRAMGFPETALFKLFLGEYGLLLLMGIAVGGVAAALAMAPTVTSSASNVSLGLQAV
ncbi:MAG: FtsX-like permease family protein, partial [Nitrospiraceae bacterium]|nr:FtsX-like permease family protein [Nitrospiraceae bacterium]